MELYQNVLLFAGIFLVVRFLLGRYLTRWVKRKKLEQEYFEVLNMPQYRVKGAFEE